LTHSDIEKAGSLAEDLAIKIRKSGGNLSIVYYKLEEILIDYRKNGGELDLIMPALYQVDLESNRTLPDGRSIWVAYADVLHENLCSPNGILHKKIQAEKDVTGEDIVKLIMDQLRLPSNSAFIVAPIAGSILGLGVGAFCKHDGECK
jgi:hypothetical protein